MYGFIVSLAVNVKISDFLYSSIFFIPIKLNNLFQSGHSQNTIIKPANVIMIE